MSDRRAVIFLATASDESGTIHSRGWEFPADEDAMDTFAATLTEAYGEPVEWVSDDTGLPGSPRIVFFETAPQAE